MNQHRKILFIDRDGTLILEPADEQIDTFEKLAFVPGVISALAQLQQAGYELVMVTNQDGLGTASFPEEEFWGPHRLMLQIFAAEDILFDDVLIDRHFEQDNAFTRKPNIGLVLDYLKAGTLDLQRSYVIGDRDTDLQLAENMGIQGLKLGPDDHSWSTIVAQILEQHRCAEINRITHETSVQARVDLDQTGGNQLNTGIGFFDHMLDQLASHAGFQLILTAAGDLHIDEHHTVEDCAIVLGQALRQALGDKRGIGRYGFWLPMDESTAQVTLDLSGRPAFKLHGQFPREQVGGLSTEMVGHFFLSLSQHLNAALHIQVQGDNTHHMIEAIFKAVGRALRPALAKHSEILPSTKGVL